MGMDVHQRLKRVQQKIRFRGITLTLDALRLVCNHMEESPVSDDEALDEVLAGIDKVSVKSNIVSDEVILEVLASLAGGAANERNPIFVVDMINLPKFSYNPARKVFYRHEGKLSIHGDALSKADLYRDRFQLLQQRVLRDKHFTKPAFGWYGSETGSCELMPLEALVGRRGRLWVMGTISQVDDGSYCLEDLTGSIHVDFSEAKITTGFITENCVIVAEGHLLSNDIFKIRTLGFPPLENRSESLAVTAGLDFFGAGALTFDEIVRLEQLEKKAVDHMFIILSEIWLDNEETMQKLATVLSGYESMEVVPSLFILMGNFCSHPCNLAFHGFSKMRSDFERLGALISSHPRIRERSRFVFIPGPDDPGPGNVLPRPPLPKYFSNEILKHVPNATFASNPCRIRFYSQEIVLFREDLLHRMRRNSIMPPCEEETKDPFEQLVATVTHQSHLCPLPLTEQPVSWPLDHTLRLYPTPHTIVLADTLIHQVFRYTGVTCCSPGSFSSNGAFIAYHPATNDPELSCV